MANITGTCSCIQDLSLLQQVLFKVESSGTWRRGDW